MFQVKIYLLMLSKYPRKSRGYFGYRLETIDKRGRAHEKIVYDEENDITANQLALVAMYRAFEELKSPCEVEVFTDSLYLRGNFVSNMQNWTLHSWMNSKGEPVANGDLWRKLEKATEQHVVRFNTEYQWPARGRMTRELMERKEKGGR